MAVVIIDYVVYLPTECFLADAYGQPATVTRRKLIEARILTRISACQQMHRRQHANFSSSFMVSKV
jgi:hypothetical protein